MSVGDVLTIVVPLVVPIVVGYVIVQVGLLPAASAHTLTTVFLYVCAPALLITTLASEDLGDLLDGRFTLGCVVVFGVVYGAVYGLFKVGLGRSTPVSAFGAFSAAGFNALAIGLPVLVGVLGRRAAVPAVIATIVFLVVLVPTTLALADVGRDGEERRNGQDDPERDDDRDHGAGSALADALWSTATNPIVIATAIGLVLAALDVTLPTVVDSSLENLGGATVLTALLALGMSIDIGDLRTAGAEVVWMSAIRLVVAPALALAIALVFAVSDFFAAAFVIAFCLPTAKSVFVLAEQYGAYERRVAGIVTLTTLGAVVALPVWVLIADAIWSDAFPT